MTADFAAKIAAHAAEIIATMDKTDRDFIMAQPIDAQIKIVAAMLASAA